MRKPALIEFLWPPVVNDDYLEAARKRCLMVISLTAAAAGLWSGSLNLSASFAEYPVQTVFALVAPAVLLACPVLLTLGIRTRVVAYFFLGVTFAAMLAVPVIAGGMFSRATLFMLAWAVLTTLFLGWREGLAAAAVVFCSYMGLHHFRHDIPPSVHEISLETISGWLFFGLSLTLLILIIGAATIQREMERATTKLSEARAEAEAANKAKSEFLAKMSHEIRTPMNGVLGMAEVLSKSSLTGEQRLYADTIMSSGKSLLTIINDILDFSKVEAGRLTLRNDVFHLKSLVDQIEVLFATSARQRQIDFIVAYHAPADIKLIGDADRIRQVLINLVGNAIKFTNKGYVKLCVEANIKTDAAQVEFSVQDTGVGISADKLERVFEDFEQAESTTTRRFGGAGLGLTISKQLAEAMNGEISVRSALGQGSTFTFTAPLPLAPDETRESKPEKSVEKAALETRATNHSRVRILAAEDNEVNRLVLNTMIEPEGYEIDFAVDGAEAVKMFKNERYDIVLMDVSMPVMDGMEATRAIRRYERSISAPQTPIICLTAHAIEGQSSKFLESGMDDILTKPLSAKDVMSMLAKWTSARSNDYQAISGH